MDDLSVFPIFKRVNQVVVVVKETSMKKKKKKPLKGMVTEERIFSLMKIIEIA